MKAKARVLGDRLSEALDGIGRRKRRSTKHLLGARAVDLGPTRTPRTR